MLKVRYIRRIMIAAGLLFYLSGCVEDPYKDDYSEFKVYDEVPAGTWLAERSEYSEYVKLLHKADLFNSLNVSLDNYTVFVSGNQAVLRCISEMYQKSSVAALTQEEAEELVQYHVIPGYKIAAGEMYLKLTAQTASYDYLTAGVDETSQRRYIMNKTGIDNSFFVQYDIEVVNGFIHVLDNMLYPVRESVWDLLRDDPNGRYSIFADLIEMSQDSLVPFLSRKTKVVRTTTIRDNKTVFAVPNEVYNDNGIADVYDLVNLVAPGESPGEMMDTTSAIFHYAVYHIIYNSAPWDEISTFPEAPIDGSNNPYTGSMNEMIKYTMHPARGLSIENRDNDVWFNYHVEAEDEYAPFRITAKDIPARNGFIHEVDNVMTVPSHMAYYVVEWELTTDINYTAIDFYRRETKAGEAKMTYDLRPGEIGGLTWVSTPPNRARVWYQSEYRMDKNPGRYLNNDALYWDLGPIGEMQISVPTIPVGRYQIKAEKSTGAGGTYRMDWGTVNIGMAANFGNTTEIATWKPGAADAMTFLIEESGLTFKLKTTTVVGEGGLDRLIFLPAHWSFDPVIEP